MIPLKYVAIRKVGKNLFVYLYTLKNQQFREELVNFGGISGGGRGKSGHLTVWEGKRKKEKIQQFIYC